MISLALPFSAPNLAAQQQQSPPKQQQQPAANSGQMQDMPGMDQDMPGMKMGQGAEEKDPQAEHGAMDAMSHMHHHQMGPHMYMTKLRPSNPQDWAKADEIVKELRESIKKYKDYHVALADGFRIFMPNVPQAEYHFTNYYYAYLESFSFDPTRPTSLLYKKTKTGYDLIGAMYTMPKRVSEEQLNERVPLSVAQWHLHTKLCMPPRGRARTCGPDPLRPDRFDYYERGLHQGRRHILSRDFRLDGARLSVRGYARKNLGAVAEEPASNFRPRN